MITERFQARGPTLVTRAVPKTTAAYLARDAWRWSARAAGLPEDVWHVWTGLWRGAIGQDNAEQKQLSRESGHAQHGGSMMRFHARARTH